LGSLRDQKSQISKYEKELEIKRQFDKSSFVGIFSETGNAPYVIRKCIFDPNLQQGKRPKKLLNTFNYIGDYYVPYDEFCKVRHRVYLVLKTAETYWRIYSSIKEAERDIPYRSERIR
jgi:hypothetical protein